MEGGRLGGCENDTVDGCEILHQLIGCLSHFLDILGVSTILSVVQDFATIQSWLNR